MLSASKSRMGTYWPDLILATTFAEIGGRAEDTPLRLRYCQSWSVERDERVRCPPSRLTPQSRVCQSWVWSRCCCLPLRILARSRELRLEVASRALWKRRKRSSDRLAPRPGLLKCTMHEPTWCQILAALWPGRPATWPVGRICPKARYLAVSLTGCLVRLRLRHL